MKMFITPSAPSGAKARGRQLKFCAAIVIFATSTILLTGAPDDAPLSVFDEKVNATTFWIKNEQFGGDSPVFLQVSNKNKRGLGQLAFVQFN